MKRLLIGLLAVVLGSIVLPNGGKHSVDVLAVALTSTKQPECKQDFGDPERVIVAGYDSDIMEPGISKDGRYLLFNDKGGGPADKDMYWSTRIDATHFKYMGKLDSINSNTVDGTPSFDLAGNLYFTSLVTYAETQKSIYIGKFDNGKLKHITVLDGDIYVGQPGWVSLDPDISPDGDMLYFSLAHFTGAPLPDSFDVRAARKVEDRFIVDESLTVNINTDDLEYAPAISADGKELFFTRTRVEDGNHSQNGIFVAQRDSIDDPFGIPERISTIKGGFVEAPTLTLDGKILYFHMEERGKFALYRITRCLNS